MDLLRQPHTYGGSVLDPVLQAIGVVEFDLAEVAVAGAFSSPIPCLLAIYGRLRQQRWLG